MDLVKDCCHQTVLLAYTLISHSGTATVHGNCRNDRVYMHMKGGHAQQDADCSSLIATCVILTFRTFNVLLVAQI